MNAFLSCFILGFPMGLILLAASCSEEKSALSDEEVDALFSKELSERQVVSSIEENDGGSGPVRSAAKRTEISQAARFRAKSFPLSFVRETPGDVSLGRFTVRELLLFEDPLQRFPLRSLQPQDTKELFQETLRMAQRTSREGRLRIFKDLEIFVVFKEAYAALSPESQTGWIREWHDKYGSVLRPEPEIKDYYPLFWLRGNPIIWKRGGRFWWWAMPALMQDRRFRIDDAGRVIITLDSINRTFSS